MLVGQHMNEAPVTITGDDLLSEAQAKMRRGGFRRLPVVSNGTLIGIVTDRDLRLHAGHLERTTVNGAMTEKVRTVNPSTTLEEAAQIMLKFQIAVCPWLKMTARWNHYDEDVMKAFLDTMGASQPAATGSILSGGKAWLTGSLEVVSREGGEFWESGPIGKNRRQRFAIYAVAATPTDC
jgi:hypothetical protein